MKKHKFLFCTYPPLWQKGGSMVMHLFAKMLCDMGEEVYITLAHNVADREKYQTKLPENKAIALEYNDAVTLAQKDDVVVIYPEIVSGNPMNAKHVVRWILYYPGGHGAGDLTYNSSDLIFTYFDRYLNGTPYENSPLLTIVETRLNQFYPIHHVEKKYDCILVKKGAANFERLKEKYIVPNQKILDKQFFILDTVLDKLNNISDLNMLFNQVRYFISFDQATYYNIMASLSGCTSIVLPIDELSKEQWMQQMPTYRYGVAYGFDDIERANETKPQLISLLQETEKENFVHAENFVKLVNERWS